MSFSTNKPTGDSLPHPADGISSTRRTTNAPAFQPQILRSVRLHPLLAAGVAALVFAALVGYGLRLKSTYEATSLVYADPAASKLIGDGAAAPFDSVKYDAFLSDQMQMVQRTDTVKAAIAALPESTWHAFGANERQAAASLQAQLKVVRVPSSYQISIALQGTDPVKTADVVNAVTTAYLDAVRRASSEEADQRAQILADERQRIDAELQSARAEQTALGASLGVANAGGGSSNPYDEQLSGIRAELISAREAHDVAAAQLSALSGVGPIQTSGLTAAADELIANDAGLASLKATIGQRRATLTEQMSGMTPNNPIYKQDQDSIAEMDRTLNTTTADLRAKAERRLQDKVKSELERTGDLESRLNAQLAQQIGKATGAAPKLQRATEVASDIQRLDARQASVDDAVRALRLQSVGPAQVRLAEAAAVPEAPLPNRKKLLLLAALPLALLFGAAAAVFARKRDTHIYAGRDMEELLGFPPLAVLPARADVSPRVFDEYVLRLAAGIESAYKNGGARTFLLTAVSLTTDIDPVGTALARKFEELGLDVVVATTSEVLAPSEQAATTELAVAGNGFVAANIAKIKAEHGLVLIEAEALLNCAQTEYVARCTDATILLIECGVTTRMELLDSVSLLQRLNVTGIGAVLAELQLRFADPNYLQAIEALNRRQNSVAPRLEPRQEPRPEWRPEPIPESRAMAGTTMQAESDLPGFVPEAEIEPATVEASVESNPEEALFEASHETETETATVTTVPAIAAELGRKSEPDVVTEVEEEVLEEEAANGTNSQGTPRRGFAAFGGRRPVLVAGLERGSQGTEKIDAMPSNRGNWTDPREKMAPGLSARRSDPPSDGEESMSRTSSWLDRLLGRKAGPTYSIVPTPSGRLSTEDADEYDDYEEDDESAIPSIRTRATSREDDFDLPDVAGLEPVTLRPHPSDLTRLQIVPADYTPEDAFGEEAHEYEKAHLEEVEPSLPVEAFQQAFEDVEPITPPTPVTPPMAAAAEEIAPPLAPPAETAFVEHWVDEPVEEAAAPVETAPAPAPAPIRGPRPLSFQQLAGIEPAAAAPPVIETIPEPAAAQTPAPEPEVVASEAPEYEVPEPQFIEAQALVDQVAEPAVSVEPTVASYEPLPEPAAPAPELPAPAKFAGGVQPHVPEDSLSEWDELSSVGRPAYRPEQAAPAPVRPAFFEDRPVEYKPVDSHPIHAELSESDDIEPVYREASRNLTTGRWDPIPPLRPAENGWRDRPAPAPPAKPERRRWSDFVQEDLDVTAANRWAGPRPGKPGPPTDSLPEPLLTRQWGLLSRFQQARNLSSGSRRPANSDAERETDSQDRRRE